MNLYKVELFLYSLAAVCFGGCTIISISDHNWVGAILYGMCTACEAFAAVFKYISIKNKNS